jgi:hypothetical protein
MARSNAAPMDFAWEDGHGPVDPNSPFISAIQRHKSGSQTNHHQKRPFVMQPIEHVSNTGRRPKRV